MISFKTYANHGITMLRIGHRTGALLEHIKGRRTKTNMENEEYWTTICKRASVLLHDDNLVWSDDFEAIRKDLGYFIYMNPGDTFARLISARLLVKHG